VPAAADVPASEVELEALTRAWLEELRLRRPAGTPYADDLGLAAQAQQLVDDDRRREGLRLGAGKLVIERLHAHESGLVDLEASVVYPPDKVARSREPAPGRKLEQLRVELGAAYWERDELGSWRLHDYVRDQGRMSATWCTHPLGEDVADTAGVGAVPQAITVDARRAGRLYLEVHSERDEPALLRVGRPPRPRGLFRRQPAVEPPAVGIPLPAHGSTHLVGRTGRPKLTEVEIFVFDEATLAQLAELRVQVELPMGHPGADGAGCTDAPAE
jgi:hypothetical protein